MSFWSKDSEQFIERNIELIEQNQFEKLWENATRKFTPRFIFMVTEILLAAGIDPTTGMDYIPENFLRNSYLTEYTIPSHIKTIQRKAFSHTKFESIVIPSNVVEIAEYVLFNCTKLKQVVIEEGLRIIPPGTFSYSDYIEKIYLPRSIEQISLDAFETTKEDRSNLVIYYAGTKADWNSIRKVDIQLNDLAGSKVVCTDGEINL